MRVNRVIGTIDAHAGGEPLRIITSGVPRLIGETVLDRRTYFENCHDDIRRFLLFEPRGHADMYGAILTEPDSPDADYGVIFLTNEGYSTMCGHGIIALTTALIDTGALPATEPLTRVEYDAPAGRISAAATVTDGRVEKVSFANVPAFQLVAGLDIRVADRTMTVDIAWGGAFYALVEDQDIGIDINADNTHHLVRWGMDIKRAVSEAIDVEHPTDPRLSGLYGTIISGPPIDPTSDGRNITIYADGAVDRSPCGTGTSAKLAVLHGSGRIRTHQPYLHESIIGTTFEGRITGDTSIDGHPAVTTEISGRGFVTGFHQFVWDPDDPATPGFRIR